MQDSSYDRNKTLISGAFPDIAGRRSPHPGPAILGNDEMRPDSVPNFSSTLAFAIRWIQTVLRSESVKGETSRLLNPWPCATLDFLSQQRSSARRKSI